VELKGGGLTLLPLGGPYALMACARTILPSGFTFLLLPFIEETEKIALKILAAVAYRNKNINLRQKATRAILLKRGGKLIICNA
jgi:hypothetical protein